jgi:hypothetical protein
MAASSAKIVKLEIEGFSDPKFSSSVGDKFVAPINPEKYSMTYSKAALDSKPKTTATTEEIPVNELLDKRTLNLSFFLDSTGVLKDNDNKPITKSVDKTIAEFNKVCTDVNGKIHTNNYLAVKWGELDFLCKMDSLKIDYRLFSPDGKPVRALLDCSFKEHIDPEVSARRANKSSPDMSHLRTIRAGDNLPSMCNEIYGDPKYYLQVAEINNILNFRDLKPGTEVLFPSIEKI